MAKLLLIDSHSETYYYDSNITYHEAMLSVRGTFGQYPVYPNYTIASIPYSCISPQTHIQFKTVALVKKIFKNYLVEIRFKTFFTVFNDQSLNTSVSRFHEIVKEVQENFNASKFDYSKLTEKIN